MKKIFTFLVPALFFSIFSLKAQVLFLETFDNIPGPTAGGPGTYAFPTGWVVANVDNQTPFADIAYVTDAWSRDEYSTFNLSDTVALSTSWYDPPGQADDWMWTPVINLTGNTTTILSWNALAYGAFYPDGYEVRIMTMPPTGSTGHLGNMIDSSSLLLSVPEENSTWTSRFLDISSYNGSTVYIGFRNNSDDKFLLAIDDIKVEVLPGFDAQIVRLASFEYVQQPLNQGPVVLGGTIKNAGSKFITNVNLKADVYDRFYALVYSASGTAKNSLDPGGSQMFNIPPWIPTGKGAYTIKYYPVLKEIDDMPSNDTFTRRIMITDSVFARDNENNIGSLGIENLLGYSYSEGGYLGQAFTIISPVYLTSVTVRYNRGYTGKKYAVAIWSTSIIGVPDRIIASTDTLIYSSADSLLTTIPIHGGKYFLGPGNYVVTAIEFDSTLALSVADSVFTPKTLWVNWPAAGGWFNVETLYPAVARAFYLRLNISTAGALPLKLLSFTGNQTSAGNHLQWKVQEQRNIQEYVIERSSGGLHFISIGSQKAINQAYYSYDFVDVSPVSNINFYRIKILEYNNSSYSSIIRLNGSGKNILTLTPNPVKNMVVIQSNGSYLLHTTATLRSLEGKLVKQVEIDQFPFHIDVSTLSKGMYFLELEDRSVLKIIKE